MYMQYIDDEAEEEDEDDTEHNSETERGVSESDSGQDTTLSDTILSMAMMEAMVVDQPTSTGAPMVLDVPVSSVVQGKKRSAEDAEMTSVADIQPTRNKKRAVGDIASGYGTSSTSGRVTRSRAGASVKI